MAQKKYTPNGLHSITPMVAIKSAASAIEWYKKVFDATEHYRLTDTEGNVTHAEIRIGDSTIMVAEEHPDYNKSPTTLNGTSVIFNLYVPDVDLIFDRAVQANSKVIFPVKDQFYGDRTGRIQDPFGHMWIISTHIKDVSPEEMKKQPE